MKKLITTALVCLSVAGAATGSALAAQPGAAVNNPNANACWGMDRSSYASENFFAGNMDIKQSFPTALGKVGDQKAAWVATYCDPHGPDA
jgi:hypothetical protein